MLQRLSRSYAQSDNSAKAAISLLAVLFFAAVGGSCTGKAVAWFYSPSRRCKVAVGYSGIFGKAAVDLSCGAERVEVFRSNHDAVITFADVYWLPDESAFAAIIAGSSRWTIGYDMKRKTTVPSAPMLDGLGQKICKDYRLTGCKDPLGWAWSAEGQAAFFSTSGPVLR